jgi:20S proteasome alpha/beta subunit
VKGGQVRKISGLLLFFFFFFLLIWLEKVFSITMGGSLVKERFAIGGSGSIYVMGYCDANYRPDMTRDECLKFVRTALALAM